MDVFVRDIPHHATQREVQDFFSKPLQKCGVTKYYCEKSQGKPFANITFHDVQQAERFLAIHGVLQRTPHKVLAVRPLYWGKRPVRCVRSEHAPSNISLRSIIYHTTRESNVPPTKHHSHNTSRFDINQLQCGSWDYSEDCLVFLNQISETQPGSIVFGSQYVVILIGTPGGDQYRLDIPYFSCHHITLGTYREPYVTFTLKFAPKIYKIRVEDILTAKLMNLMLIPRVTGGPQAKKCRVLGLNDDHAKIAGLCFVYRVRLFDPHAMSSLRRLRGMRTKMPTFYHTDAPSVRPSERIDHTMSILITELSSTKLPFTVGFQCQRLAYDGALLPSKVLSILPLVQRLLAPSTNRAEKVASSLRSLGLTLPFAGPETDAREVSIDEIERLLQKGCRSYDQRASDNPYELVKRFQHLIPVHRLVVTPVGLYLEGPDAEPANRVMRRYSERIDCFVRVIFQDEDRASVRYDPRADQSVIFNTRFRGFLLNKIAISGRLYQFLGFSHSSLRSQTCWFMSPFMINGTLLLTDHLVEALGDFSNIRIPAKCAARIGQNFTDTTASVNLDPLNTGWLPNIERCGRDFSDGCGTISQALLTKIWRRYGTRRASKPTVLQIRFKGFKGVVSLDNRLQGERIMLRDNMNKFETSEIVRNLEICGAAFTALPLFLNRPLIKILEDLGIPGSVLLELQSIAVDQLKYMTKSPTNTVAYLDSTSVPKAARLGTLIGHLKDIDLDYHDDAFLLQVVEMSMVAKLQEMKYRGRIPVEKGYTLYGIVDETGFLKEGEIFVPVIDSITGQRTVLNQARVAITRSPAMHPGDVQVVSAVNVPENSQLQALYNVVVFSQHGDRDLPSQLSGGDLDGDLYNVIYHPDLVPRETYVAGDYPRQEPKKLNRTVKLEDMSEFFVRFMETDLLGMISNIHLQLADQKDLGILDPDCVKLAEMASTAVDFSKTGIAVDMKECPKYDRCKPDFMSHSPRVFISQEGFVDLQNEEDTSQDDDFAALGLDQERRPQRYYESQKILGQLYRAIDDRKLLKELRQHRPHASLTNGGPESLMNRLWKHLQQRASDYGILYKHHEKLARAIRDNYEENLRDILWKYGPTPRTPVTEEEAWAGQILGRQFGPIDKPLREISNEMKDRFTNVVDYTNMRITRGDELMHSVDDLDELYDTIYDEREFEALPRAMACLEVAITEPGSSVKGSGELKSFKYVAAGAALRELERYCITTFGYAVL